MSHVKAGRDAPKPTTQEQKCTKCHGSGQTPGREIGPISRKFPACLKCSRCGGSGNEPGGASQ